MEFFSFHMNSPAPRKAQINWTEGSKDSKTSAYRAPDPNDTFDHAVRDLVPSAFVGAGGLTMVAAAGWALGPAAGAIGLGVWAVVAGGWLLRRI